MFPLSKLNEILINLPINGIGKAEIYFEDALHAEVVGVISHYRLANHFRTGRVLSGDSEIRGPQVMVKRVPF